MKLPRVLRSGPSRPTTEPTDAMEGTSEPAGPNQTLSRLIDSYVAWLRDLEHIPLETTDIESVRRIQPLWINAIDQVQVALSSHSSISASSIGELVVEIAEAIRAWPATVHRDSLATLCCLLATIDAGAEDPPKGELKVDRVSETDGASQVIVIPTELLLQCWNQLLPPERMAVFAGRHQTDGSLRITAAHDVTGPANEVHVGADRRKLHRALVLMETTGSFLAGWMHSHPGAGPGGTIPSPIDTGQQRWFTDNYGGFRLGFVATKDGWIRRFWADDHDRQPCLLLEGTGLEQAEPSVYRIVDGSRDGV